jgi:catechol 2,3-dioxygenase-like lactoylglutathione lyase family enzyme
MPLTRVIPSLPVADIPAAAAFYAQKLAFPVVHAEDGMAIVKRDEAEVHLWLAGDRSWQTRDAIDRPVRSGAESFLAGTASCRIAADDLDALFVEFTDAGVVHPISTTGPADMPYGLRELHVLDLDGNLITFFHPL